MGFYDAVVGLFHVLVDGDAADAVCHDMSARGVLEMLKMSADVGIDMTVFKHAVARFVEGTVLEHQIVGIAQELFANEVTIHQAYILRVPGQVFTVEYGVVDVDVLAFPERVFCNDVRISQFHVPAILKHVF